MVDEDNTNYQRETVRLLREQNDALKEQQRIADQTTEQNKAQVSLSKTLAKLAAEQASAGEDSLRYTRETKDVSKELNKAKATATGLEREMKLATGEVAKLLAEQK